MPQNQSGTTWITMAFVASIMFCIASASKTYITARVGWLSNLYTCGGSVLVGLIHNFKEACHNYSSTGTFWNNQNIKVDGKLSIRNLLGFVLQSCLMFIVVNIISVTVYFAYEANVNPDLITGIWSITPILACAVDFYWFGVNLEKHHIQSVLLTVLGVALLGLNYQEQPIMGAEPLSSSYLIIFGLLSSLWFVFGGSFAKYLVLKNDFEKTTLTISAQAFSSAFILLVAIVHWS